MRYLTLVLLAVVGMLPAGLLPVIVSASHGSLGFTLAQSASLGGIAIFCTALGACAIALRGVPGRWKRAAAVGLALLAMLDIASIGLTDFATLLAVRGVHGLVGGMLTGVGYAMIGRTSVPDRLFGMLLALQFVAGGVGIAVLPGWIATGGMGVLFGTLAAAAALLLALVPIMPELRVAVPSAAVFPVTDRLPRGALLRGLAALLLIQAGHTAGGAFMLEIGRMRGIGLPAVQSIVGLGAMAGVVGAFAAAVLGVRHGRRLPVLGAGVAGLAAGGLLLVPSPVAFAAGSAIGSVAWAGSIPYVLGACAAVDRDGRGAMWSSFVAKLGLAAGPLLGALAVGRHDVELAVILSCALGIAGTLLFLRLDTATPTLSIAPR